MTFKCYFYIKGEKHEVLLKSNVNWIELNTVLRTYRFLTQSLRHTSLSFQTHLFELYNKDIKQYSVIKSDKQMIKNMSQIRISLKSKPDPKPDHELKSINRKIKSIEREIEENVKFEELVSKSISRNCSPFIIKDEINDKPLNSETLKNTFQLKYDTNSSFKRIVEENEDKLNNDYSFLKRIKKDINKTPIAIKPSVKEEIDLKVNDNLTQTVVNSFSHLSLTNSLALSLPSTSTQFNANSVSKTEQNDNSLSCEDIDEDLKRMKINSCDDKELRMTPIFTKLLNINWKKNMLKKNRKDLKRLKILKSKAKHNKKVNNSIDNEDEKSSVGKHKSIYKSLVIKELKVSVNHNTTQEEIDSLIALKKEGIVLKMGKKCDKFKCLLCEEWFKSIQLAEEHANCVKHFGAKYEENIKGMDRTFALDIGKSRDIEVILRRKEELQKIGSKLKQICLIHGIRLKNGFGFSAYVCLKCNLWFDSLPDVRYHLEVYNRVHFNNVHFQSSSNIITPFPFDPVIGMNDLNID